MSTYQESDIPDHKWGCGGIIGWVDRTGTPRGFFKWMGGWGCPRCTWERVEDLDRHLRKTVVTPIAYRGELPTESAARSAAQQARRISEARGRDVGRVLVRRSDASYLLLASANLTPRSRQARPTVSLRGVEWLVDRLATSSVKQVTVKGAWQRAKVSHSHAGGIRVEPTSAEIFNEAVRAAGYEVGIPSGVDPAIVAAKISLHIERLRAERDDAGSWAELRDKGKAGALQ